MNDNELILPAARVKVSSLSSLDQLIINSDSPSAKVTFTSDIGTKMEVDVKIDQKNDVLIRINFYYKNVKIHYGKLDRRQLTILVNAYREYNIEVAKKRAHVDFSWSLLKNPRLLAEIFTKITKVRNVLQRYSNIRSANVFTIIMDVSVKHFRQDYILARTALELDADIITIIPPELLSQKADEISFLMNLHTTNVILANYLFLYPLTKIFAAVKLTKNLLRILSIPLWIALSAIIFSKSITTDYVLLVINFLGVPALLYKLVPKIISLLVRSKLAQ
jgi:hypothetical protein